MTRTELKELIEEQAYPGHPIDIEIAGAINGTIEEAINTLLNIEPIREAIRKTPNP